MEAKVNLTDKADFKENYEEYLKVAKKAMETLVSDSAENAAVREKYIKESKKGDNFFGSPQPIYYEIRLHLKANQVKALVDCLEALK